MELFELHIFEVTVTGGSPNLYALGEDFPHIYGALRLDAVSAVHDLPATPDGVFELPAVLLPGSD